LKRCSSHLNFTLKLTLEVLECSSISWYSAYQLDSYVDDFYYSWKMPGFFFASENWRHSAHVSSRRQALLDDTIREIKVPSGFDSLPLLGSRMYWRACDYRNFFLFVVPCLIVPDLPPEYASSVISLICAIRLSTMENVTDDLTQAVVKLIGHFLSTFSRIYPEKCCTINVHLLRHLPEQMKRFGSLRHSTMFAFESTMKLYKSFIQGTRGHCNQIARKIIAIKGLRGHIFGCSLPPAVLTGFGCGVEKLDGLIDAHRVRRRGKEIHSCHYPRRQMSDGSLCLTNTGKFIRVCGMKIENGILLLSANILTIDSHTIDIVRGPADLFNTLSDQTFNSPMCYVTSGEEVTVPLSDVTSRALIIHYRNRNFITTIDDGYSHH
jgi:hypothetical protein